MSKIVTEQDIKILDSVKNNWSKRNEVLNNLN